MSNKKKTPDTEPDDAFSMILGDINASPMSPLSPLAEAEADSGAPPKLRHSAAHPMPGISSSLTAPLPPDTAIPATMVENAPKRAKQKPTAAHPWIEVLLDTCTVTPDVDISFACENAPAASEALRKALLVAARQKADIIRLNLDGKDCNPACLATALCFALTLQPHRPELPAKRLVFANCAPGFKTFMETVNAPLSHGVSLS